MQFFDYSGAILSYIAMALPVFVFRTYDDLSAETLASTISKVFLSIIRVNIFNHTVAQNAFITMYLINCFTRLIDLSEKASVVLGTTQRYAP